MPLASTLFYSFTGLHSFLNGLLPFYIPIILWRAGYTSLDICMFIAITALNFLLALKLWKVLYNKESWLWLLAISFISEIILVFSLVNISSNILLIVSAITYGVYNCFYWTTQRFIFSFINSKNKEASSGSLYANFQIIVFIFLKLGILIGAWLISLGNEYTVLLLSLIICVLGCSVCVYAKKIQILSVIKDKIKSSNIKEQDFNDQNRSKFIFGLDGVFLYLESFFWIMTLYFFLQENILKLGVIVILLSVVLVVLFLILKKYIDKVNIQQLYLSAVTFYAISWMLRAQFTETKAVLESSSYVLILIITFLTMFFRLCFNKRFFDHADQTPTMNYLLAKSYFSQYYLLIIFSSVYIIHKLLKYNDVNIFMLYSTASVISLFYCVYKIPIQLNNFKLTIEPVK